MENNVAIPVRLHLLSAASGGRRRPIKSGYLAACWLGSTTSGGERAYTDAAIDLFEEQLEPGEVATARLRPAFPDLWKDLKANSAIEICEGHRIIGTAVIQAAP